MRGGDPQAFAVVGDEGGIRLEATEEGALICVGEVAMEEEGCRWAPWR